MTYHHGDLREALLAAAEARIRVSGPASVSLRGLARDLGVSHAAPAHHFGTLRGLFTALAAEGHHRMGQAMQQAQQAGGFAEVGVAYVAFALDHPAHFGVMFTPELLDLDDPHLAAARAVTLGQLGAGAREVGSAASGGAEVAALAAWSLVHGLATLHLSGSLGDAAVRGVVGSGTSGSDAHREGAAPPKGAAAREEVLAMARRATGVLFAGSVAAGR